MDAIFPLGFPPATAFYLTLYVATLVVHVVFMNYVLAGASYLLLASFWGTGCRKACCWQRLIKDWIPFATGLAITAGVAPLLFVQILYQREFYTANQLLSHRFMLILPILIVCFYMLYVLKSHWIQARGTAVQIGARLVVFLGFAFIAWSWTENHLLSLDAAVWRGFYAEGRSFYVATGMFARLAMWFLGAFSTLAALLMWQARQTPGFVLDPDERSAWRRLAATGAGGLVTAGIAGAVYFLLLPAEQRAPAVSWLGGPYLAIAALGAMAQLAGWVRITRSGVTTLADRLAITIGCVATISGMAVVRESIRLGSVTLAEVQAMHADAMQIGGLGAFLGFLVLNGGLIGWTIVRTRREIFAPLSPGRGDVAA